jgi:multidrug efflux pump
LAVYLYTVVPKGFFPSQGTGRINGSAVGPEDISFQSMRQKLMQYVDIVQRDPAVDEASGFIGRPNTATLNITLKPLSQRKFSADQVVNRLRPQLARVPGANLYLQAVRDVQIGGRIGNSEFQYTLQGDNLPDLLKYSPMMEQKLRALPQIRDLNTDLQNRGLQAGLVIDRETAGRLGITASTIDNILYDAFGQREVSTIYEGINQYHVVEIDPKFQRGPTDLNNIYVPSSTGGAVPLGAFTHYESANSSLAVAHQGQFPAVTFTFNFVVAQRSGHHRVDWHYSADRDCEEECHHDDRFCDSG